MSELGNAERALLALTGDAHDPTDADRARVRAALAARLGAAAGLGVGAAVGAAATAKAATGVAAKAMAAGASGAGSVGTTSAVMTGGALAAKLVVAVAITATVGVGATVRLVRHGSRGPAPAAKSEVHNRRTAMAAPRATQATPQPQPEAPPVEAPIAEPAPAANDKPTAAPARMMTAAPVRATTSQVPAPVPAPASAVRVAEVPGPSASPAPPVAPIEAARPAARIEAQPARAAISNHRSPPAPVSRGQACGPADADLQDRRPEFTVADEARLVHDGVRALHEGQPACALSLLDTHAHFYPHGVLAEERDAERALALADLGRIAEARGVAAAFLRAHPTSPLGVHLRQRIPGIDAINHDRTGRDEAVNEPARLASKDADLVDLWVLSVDANGEALAEQKLVADLDAIYVVGHRPAARSSLSFGLSFGPTFAADQAFITDARGRIYLVGPADGSFDSTLRIDPVTGETRNVGQGFIALSASGARVAVTSQTGAVLYGADLPPSSDLPATEAAGTDRYPPNGRIVYQFKARFSSPWDGLWLATGP